MGDSSAFKVDAKGRIYISPSSVTTLLSCAAKYSFRNIHKIPDPPGIDSKLGNLVHEALEEALNYVIEENYTPKVKEVEDNAYNRAIAYFDDPESVKELRGDDPQEALTNSGAYAQKVANLAKVGWEWFINSGLTPISCERAVEYIKDYKDIKVVVGGRLDLLAKDKSGRIFIVDFKTSGKAPFKSPTGGYSMDRNHALQQLIYAKALASEGIDVYEVATLKLTKTSKPAAYYAGMKVTSGMLEWSDVITTNAIKMVYEKEFAPNPTTVLCSRKWCAFFEVCPGSAKSLMCDEGDP